MGWMVDATPRLLCPRKWPGTHCIGGLWAKGPFWTDAGNNPPPARIRSPDRPVHSLVTTLTELPRPLTLGTSVCFFLVTEWKLKIVLASLAPLGSDSPDQHTECAEAQGSSHFVLCFRHQWAPYILYNSGGISLLTLFPLPLTKPEVYTSWSGFGSRIFSVSKYLNPSQRQRWSAVWCLMGGTVAGHKASSSNHRLGRNQLREF